MTISQDEFRAAIREVAAEVTERDVPPLSLPAVNLTAQRVRRLRVRKRLLVPLAAALAVIAVIATSVILTGGPRAPEPGSNAAVRVSLGPDGVPPYYLEIAGSGNSAEIRDTAIGTTITTIRPPRSFQGFDAISGAADYWTFVLAAYKGDVLAGGTLEFLLAQFDPHTGQVALRRLPIASAPADSLDGLALSPDGRELAIAQLTRGTNRQIIAKLSVYSLTTGHVKVWQAAGIVFNSGAGLSWSSTGTLSFNFFGETGSKTPAGVWLLNTATAGGDLWSDSRLAVASRPRGGGPEQAYDGVITPAGTKIAESTLHDVHGVTTYEFRIFSVATGKLLHVLYPHASRTQETQIPAIAWANAAGNVLVVSPPFGPFGFGVLKGNQYTPIPDTRGNLQEQLAF